MKNCAGHTCFAASVILSFSLMGCGKSEYSGIESPSGTYEVFASVDRSNANARPFGLLMLRVVRNSGFESLPTNTHASTFHKWALGWMPGEDTLVLYSSDIGTSAYRVENDQLVPLEKLTDEIGQRARDLYREKYGRPAPSS